MNRNEDEDMGRLLVAAKAAVRAACRVTASVQSSAFSHITKADASPVTVADFAAQAVVTLVLQRELALFSRAPFLLMGEEDEATFRGTGPDTTARVAHLVECAIPRAAFTACAQGGSSSSAWTVEEVAAAIGAGCYPGCHNGPSFWLLDPVDGTKGFLRRGQYAVGLAYISRGSVSLAVIGCPNLPYPALTPGSLVPPDPAAADTFGAHAAIHHGTLCSAVSGSGAFQEVLHPSAEEAEAAPLRLRVNCLLPSSSDFLLVQSFEPSESDAAVSAHLRSALPIKSAPLRLDSMVKYCLVARGEAALYLRYLGAAHEECVWDHAPGALLVVEAGGICCDANGSALDFNHGKRLTENVGIVASNGAAHSAILDALKGLHLGRAPV